eukprot:scaffold88396_cov33-Tisochrysis_lutea.AAC.5
MLPAKKLRLLKPVDLIRSCSMPSSPAPLHSSTYAHYCRFMIKTIRAAGVIPAYISHSMSAADSCASERGKLKTSNTMKLPYASPNFDFVPLIGIAITIACTAAAVDSILEHLKQGCAFTHPLSTIVKTIGSWSAPDAPLLFSRPAGRRDHGGSRAAEPPSSQGIRRERPHSHLPEGRNCG